jgi:osmotically-inducible protein OsmY
MKTDAILQRDVIAELESEPSVDATSIGVEVHGGIVTLAGHIGSHAEKWAAEHAAQRVPGVIGLAVEIDVKLPASSGLEDADIARSAANVLQWTANVPESTVKVMVENGWITLSGEVEWGYQSRCAAEAVRNLMGVTGVSDQIGIKAGVTSDAIKSNIEASLKRRARSDEQSIAVSVSGSHVTLTGIADTWFDRELANHSAWGTPGVRSVVDYIAIGN